MTSPEDYMATANKIVKSVMNSLTDKAGKSYYNQAIAALREAIIRTKEGMTYA